MKVDSIYLRNVIVADSKSSVLKATQLMRQHHVGTVVVVDDVAGKNRPIGMVTDRDIVIKVIAKNIPAEEIRLQDIMVKDLVFIRDDEDIIETIRIMCVEGVRRVPIINHNGRLVGILSVDDIFEMLADELNHIAMLIRKGQQLENKLQCSQ